jgi:hypothetical protein
MQLWPSRATAQIGIVVARGGSMSYRTVSAAALFAALFAVGCGTAISSTVINSSPHPMNARPPETVEVFSSGPPARPHVDVALLEAEQRSDLSADNIPQFVNHLRARAAAMGCDGIVLGGVTNTTDASWTTTNNGSRKGITATCIVYQGPDGPGGPDAQPPGPPPAMTPPPPAAPPAG